MNKFVGNFLTRSRSRLFFLPEVAEEFPNIFKQNGLDPELKNLCSDPEKIIPDPQHGIFFNFGFLNPGLGDRMTAVNGTTQLIFKIYLQTS